MSVVDKEKGEGAGETLDSTAETYLSLRYMQTEDTFSPQETKSTNHHTRGMHGQGTEIC